MLCVSGYSGSGKDEFVRKLVENGDPKVGLADPAKRHMADLYGFTEEQLFGPSASRNAGDLRYPKQDFVDLGLALSSVTAQEPPEGLTGELVPGRYWEYVGRGGEQKLPYVPGKLGSARIFVPEGHPSFWLSPREALQRYCELMNLMYENTWIRKGIQTHKELSKVATDNGRTRLVHGYHRMRGLYSPEYFQPAPGPEEAFVSCSADFRHRHEIKETAASATDDFVPVLVRVKRASVPEPPFPHRSETEMKTIPDSAFDYVVNNDSTVDSLHDIAAAIVIDASRADWQPRRKPL